MTDSKLCRRTVLATAGASVLSSGGLASADSTESVDERPPEPGEYEAILDAMDGTGSENDPYVITDVCELQAMAGDHGASYELGGDIDATVTSDWNEGSDFEPIAFTGKLDGAGHAIVGLYVDRESDVGLFSHCRAEVKNVSLVDVEISGHENVGALAGNLNGYVSSCSVSGVVEGDETEGGLVGRAPSDFNSINDVHLSCDVRGTNDIGGVVGFGDTSVESAVMTGTVTGDSSVGGVIGKTTRGGMGDLFVTGSVEGEKEIGGLVGNSGSHIYSSIAAGSVAGTEIVGGLVGKHMLGALEDVAAVNEVRGDELVGGLVGEMVGVTAEHKPDIERSVATGPLSGERGALVGGVVDGWIDESRDSILHVSDCHWDQERIEDADPVGVQPDDVETELVVEGVEGVDRDDLRGDAAADALARLDFEETWTTGATQEGYPAPVEAPLSPDDVDAPLLPDEFESGTGCPSLDALDDRDGRDDSTDETNDDSVPGPGILGSLLRLGGTAYLLARRRDRDDST